MRLFTVLLYTVQIFEKCEYSTYQKIFFLLPQKNSKSGLPGYNLQNLKLPLFNVQFYRSFDKWIQVSNCHCNQDTEQFHHPQNPLVPAYKKNYSHALSYTQLLATTDLFSLLQFCFLICCINGITQQHTVLKPLSIVCLQLLHAVQPTSSPLLLLRRKHFTAWIYSTLFTYYQVKDILVASSFGKL